MVLVLWGDKGEDNPDHPVRHDEQGGGDGHYPVTPPYTSPGFVLLFLCAICFYLGSCFILFWLLVVAAAETFTHSNN